MLPHVAAVLLSLAVTSASVPPPTVAFRFADPRIAESSGLVAASTGELVFTHNDSGDEARFFAVGLDGRTRTTYVLPDVQARDWEDLARGPDEQGRSSLWLGDIGDNDGVRNNGVLIHRIAEPAPTDREQVTTEAPTDFRLRYPDRPVDAETLLVHPRTGRLYLVTKPLAGTAQVYAAPEVLDADGPNVLELVAEAPAQSTGTAGGPGIGMLANWLFTAGDIAPDGSRLALRTYTDVYEWTIPGDDVAAAFDREPTVTPLPPAEQGEGLGYAADGASVLVSSEGAGSAVDRVVLPAPSDGAPDDEAPDAARDATADEAPAGSSPLRRWGADQRPQLAAGAGVVLIAALLAGSRRRRSRRGRG